MPIILRILMCLSCILTNYTYLIAQGACSTPGAILTGSSTILDANSDGFFSQYSSSGYTLTRNEFTEFESLAGVGGANVDWTRLGGVDPNDDLQSGGGCGNTDIVTDTDGGSDYGYFSIVDPDGTADNGDEYLAMAIRVANKINGAFGFSFLMDSDNNCSTGDSDATCGNPCFEYEIQLSTSNSGGEVEVYNVDGCYGTSPCDISAGGDATVCAPCNSQGIQVCADSSACGDGPVFWVYFISFSQLPGVNSTTAFSLTPASNTSGNQIIYKSANVSDYGGLDDINDIGAGSCGCTLICSGSGCSNCEQDCALGCAAQANAINTPLPVVWLGFSGIEDENGNHLRWEVARESEVLGYQVERSINGSFFQKIAVLSPHQSSNLTKQYVYTDRELSNGVSILYRIKQLDINGSYSFSPIISLQSILLKTHIYADEAEKMLYLSGGESTSQLSIFQSSGQLMYQRQSLQLGQSISYTNWPSGVYLISVRNSSGIILREKVFLR